MPLYLAEHPKRRRSTSGKHRYESIGYRIYPTSDRVGYADENNSRFRDLLFGLKAGTATALELFSGLLCLIYDDVLDAPQAIACVPPSEKSESLRDDPLALLVQMAIAKGIGALDGSSWLLRTKTVPKAHQNSGMRKYEKQLESIMCVPSATPASITSILLVDDIRTSGQTMDACVDRLRQGFPAVTVTGFSFGYTGWVPAQSPNVPDWPKAKISAHAARGIIENWQSEAWPLPVKKTDSPFFADGKFVHVTERRCRRPASDSTDIWDRNEADATLLPFCPRCRPFSERPVFVFSRYSRKIHQVDCRTGPTGSGAEPLWSLRHGIRRGGKPCHNCMYRWQTAALLATD